MSGAELRTIQRLAYGVSKQEKDHRRKQQLKQQSRNRYKNWGNTLEAQREKKKADRKKRLDAIENAQRLIDAEENEYQAQQKRKAIDRANQMLYNENGRVKTFKSALLLSGIEQERLAQIALKKRINASEKVRDSRWHNQMLDTVKALEDREANEKQAQIDKAAKIRAVRIHQLDLFHEKTLAEREERIREGEVARALAVQAEKEGLEQEKVRVQAMRANNMDWHQRNEALIEHRKIKYAIEAAEDAKIKKYSREKEQMLTLRSKRTAERKAAKLAHQQKLIDDQYERLSRIVNNEDQRVAKEVALADAKREDLHQKKIQRQQQQKNLIDKSRAQQLKRRQDERDRQTAEDTALKKYWTQLNSEMEAQDAENERKTKENADRLAAFLKQQHSQKQASLDKQRQESMAEAQRLQDMYAKEEEIFKQYTQAHIDVFREQNLSTKPMEIALEREHIRNTRLKV